ncbi:lipid-A-disaccharide synthase N-terminal domain-containing protein [Desulfatibacillum aliphaticivorans]|uniref:Lipid A biosynthesis domain protein n=1 Tax=Desulfatibacillum aliphaticivorans TaxID=218208 RepID=B8FE06_DESAL|nr:lipid-A-disaccharide synthase N-terminal domain-containing protein [Desulfatibacillum aliphaticivorans]ACL06787.1 lipid A biosynthesis domain protein [Desulfatibacillum aliphaticivorans]
MDGAMQYVSILAVSSAESVRFWLTVGFLGQALFGSRFLLQWIVSEIKKESTVPIAFWFLSLAGGVFLLAYAIHKKDPVFIVGQAGGLIIYFRNLTLIFKKRAKGETG